ncbi:MAG: NAD(P)-dependent oxidoreductase [Spirulina sp. SIO3F2]|nr:NAD(P)-dependent oxidoreductase [Spirulina sp. SIO3F2]
MNIGVIGTGLMGQPLALRLLEQGYGVTAYNRTAEKLTAIAAAGGASAPDPTAVLKNSEVVILMLTDAIAIESLLLNPATQPRLAGKTIIQMGTIAPEQSRQLDVQIQAAGGSYLEAPVLGSIPQVKTGSLLVMVGSTPEQYQAQFSLFKQLGNEPRYIGPVGTAAALKLALNQLIGSLTTAFALSLNFAQQEGVPVASLMQILRESALYAPTFDKKLQRMLEGNFTNPNFPTKHLLKDMNLFAKAATAQNTAIVQGVIDVVQNAIAQGHGDDDYSSIYNAISAIRE